jgi:hypothetical protein
MPDSKRFAVKPPTATPAPTATSAARAQNVTPASGSARLPLTTRAGATASSVTRRPARRERQFHHGVVEASRPDSDRLDLPCPLRYGGPPIGIVGNEQFPMSGLRVFYRQNERNQRIAVTLLINPEIRSVPMTEVSPVSQRPFALQVLPN